MPIDPIFLQQKYAAIGRIRAGVQVPTSGGGTRPKALSAFRLTSPYRWVIEGAAAKYGGEVRAFQNDLSNDRWEVETTATDIPVMVLPSLKPDESAVSQWFERWGRGGCTHRCTGSVAYKADGYDYRDGIPCDGTHGTCGVEARLLAEQQRFDEVPEKQRQAVCTKKTRLTVGLPEVPGTGIWRIDTGSDNAADELLGVSDWLVQATAAGYSVPAHLALLPQTRRRMVNGKAQTRHFVFPTLVADISHEAMLEIERGGAYRPELDGYRPTPIEPRRPLKLEPGHPDTPPPRRPGGRHRTVDNVVAPPKHDPPTAAEAAEAEQVELAAQAARQQRHDWFEALPFSPEDPEVGEMFALCAQRWDATYDNVSPTVRDRVARGLAQILAGELRIDREGAEVRLVKIPSGDVALSLAAEDVQPS